MKPKRPEDETPAEKFMRIAQSRTNTILENLRILGNCSNKRLYEYSQQDVDKIFGTINQRVKEIRLKFKEAKKEKFTL